MDFSDFNKSGAFLIGLSDCDEKVTAAGGRVSTGKIPPLCGFFGCGFLRPRIFGCRNDRAL